VPAVPLTSLPSDQRMFEVAAEETIALAEKEGLQTTPNVPRPSRLAENRAAGASWTTLALMKT